MDERDIAESIRRIERRLDRLERFTHLAPDPAVAREAPPPPEPAATAEARAAVAPEAPMQHAEAPVAPDAPLPRAEAGPAAEALPRPADAPASSRGAGLSSRPGWPAGRAAPAGAPPPPGGLSEQVLGGRVAAWVGAILVMIGMGVFLRYAYDQQWLARLGPWGRFIGSTAIALMLVAIGELALRRWGRAAAAGFFSAGLGSLFLIAAAGTRPEVMQVFGPTGALLFALAAIVLGAVVTARSQLMAVGVVMLLGAYLVPVLTGVLALDDSIRPAAYMTAVLVAGLSLAQFIPSQGALRGVVLGLHLPMALLVLLGRSLSPGMAQFFVILWWALLVLESLASVLRTEARHLQRMGGAAAAGVPPPRHPPAMGSLESAIATLATLASIGASFLYAGAWSGPSDPWAWLPLGQGLLCVVAAAQLGAMRSEESTPALSRLMLTLAAVGGAAILASVALLLNERAASLTWALMGAGAVFAATRIGSRGLAAAAIVALMAATVTAAWLALSGRDLSSAGMIEVAIPGFSAGRIALSQDWWLPLGVTLASVASAHWLTRPVALARGRVAAAIAAVLSFAAFSLAVGVGESGLLVAVALPAWWILGPLTREDGFHDRAGAVVATLIACICLIVIVMRLGAAGGGDPAVRSAALLLATGLMALAGRRAESTGAGRSLAMAAGAIIVFAALIELLGAPARGDPARRAMGELTTLAAFAAVAAILLRFASHRSAAMGAGVALWAAIVWSYASVVLGLLGGLGSAPPISNLSNASAALVLAALGAGLGRARAACACAGAVVVLVAGTMDLERLARSMGLAWEEQATLRQALRSVWWAAVGAAGVVAGFLWRVTALRWWSLALMAVTAIKVLLVDLQHAATLARVGALLVVGMLLVGVSVVYARAERRLRSSAPIRAAP